jgi:hypothetical protein
MRIKEGNFRALKKKTAPPEIKRRTPIEISTSKRKRETEKGCHLEEAHLINSGRYGVATKTLRR